MKYFLKTKNKKAGFTLVETLVAVGIFSLSIIALMSVLGGGVSDTNYAKQKTTAYYLAQEGMEYLLSVRANYALFSNSTGLDWQDFLVEMRTCRSNNKCGVDTSVSQTDNAAIFNCTGHNNECKLFVDNDAGYNTNSIGQDSGFVRRVWSTDYAGNARIKLFSEVTWNQGSGLQTVRFTETIYNWTE